MKTSRQQGHVLPIVLLAIGMQAALAFGVWAYMGRTDYKNNVDKKVEQAVAIASDKLVAEKDAEFVEKEKKPLRTYTSSSAYGAIAVEYPKTWSVYADEDDKSSTPVDVIFHPNFVPASKEISYALRISVVEASYDTELKRFDSAVKSAKVSISPAKLPKLPSILGSRIDGELGEKKNGIMLLLPLRDKTIKIWTEGDAFRKDFDEIILPNLVFNP